MTKNIYLQYPCNKAHIESISDEIFKINNDTLNLLRDTYDYRNSN
ncbi:hypothetical protein H8923_00645 [Romboutsia hominis]|uniref:Uncharacterized protein n=1 Tax=Romboutsia faecis TaxID=2764597 RepID=A0ABR7JK23_9FIRM|nr:hypothetical protein [Romboutsia faecis]